MTRAHRGFFLEKETHVWGMDRSPPRQQASMPPNFGGTLGRRIYLQQFQWDDRDADDSAGVGTGLRRAGCETRGPLHPPQDRTARAAPCRSLGRSSRHLRRGPRAPRRTYGEPRGPRDGCHGEGESAAATRACRGREEMTGQTDESMASRRSNPVHSPTSVRERGHRSGKGTCEKSQLQPFRPDGTRANAASALNGANHRSPAHLGERPDSPVGSSHRGE